ncbi:hypothetical protein FB451DRAFT_1206252 [Mycena latifolia]|nr:hypothetical protein FB451DRAFT_1206252 [Mycena latifolia]
MFSCDSVKNERSGGTGTSTASPCIARTFTLSTTTSSEQQTVNYNEHRGPGAPPATLGAAGDIYLDLKAPALYARYTAGWTIWPGPKQRSTPLAHPAYPDQFLWASTQRARIFWAPKDKLKKLIASTEEVLKQIIAADGRRDSRNLKRKAGETLAGAGEAKKPRVSDPTPSEPLSASRGEPSVPIAPPAKSIETPTKAKAPPAPPVQPPVEHIVPSAEHVIPKPPALSATVAAPPSIIIPANSSASSVTSASNPPTCVAPSNALPAVKPASLASSRTKPLIPSTIPAVKPAPPVTPQTMAPEAVAPSVIPTGNPSIPHVTSRTKPPSTISAINPSAPTAAPNIAPTTSRAKPPTKRAAPKAPDDGASSKRQRIQPPLAEEYSDECPSMDEAAMKEKMRPVRKELKRFKVVHETSQVKESEECLVTIGQHIDVLKEKEPAGQDRDRHTRHLWAFATFFWPNPIKGSTLRAMYENTVAKLNSDTQRTGSGSASAVSSAGGVPKTKISSHPPPPKVTLVPTVAAAAPLVRPPSPALVDLLSHMQRQTQVLKSTSAGDSSACLRSSARADRLPSAQNAVVSPVPQQVAAKDGPPIPLVSKPQRATRDLNPASSQHERRSSAAAASSARAGLSSLPSDRTLLSAASSQQQTSHDRASADLMESTLDRSKVAPNTPIAILHEQYTKCHLEGASQRRTNHLWLAEAFAATILVNALTTACDTRKDENDALKAENDALKAETKRLRSLVERLEPQNVELIQREEERWCDAPMPDIVKVKQEAMPVRVPLKAGIAIRAIDGRSGSGKPPSGAEIIDLTFDSDDEEASTPAVTAPSASKTDRASRAPPPGAGCADDKLQESDGDGEELVTEDSVPMDPPIVDLEPPTDLHSRASIPPRMSIDVALNPSDGEQGHVAVPKDPPITDFEPPTDVHSQPRTYIDVDSNASGTADAKTPPPAATSLTPGLIEPSSMPEHFRIAGTDFDYPDARLRDIVQQYDGEKDQTTRTWGGILAHLQLIMRPTTRPSAPDGPRDAFVKAQWPETVEALRGYYARYVVPRKAMVSGVTAQSAVPVEDARDMLDCVPIPVTAGATLEGRPAADPGRGPTPNMQAPSRDTPATHNTEAGATAPTAEPPITALNAGTRLVDPSTCKNAPPRAKVKIEEGVLDVAILGRLSKTHVDNLFAPEKGKLACSLCAFVGLHYTREDPSPPEQLSNHLEAQHPDMLGRILDATAGMDDVQVCDWFKSLEKEE